MNLNIDKTMRCIERSRTESRGTLVKGDIVPLVKNMSANLKARGMTIAELQELIQSANPPGMISPEHQVGRIPQIQERLVCSEETARDCINYNLLDQYTVAYMSAKLEAVVIGDDEAVLHEEQARKTLMKHFMRASGLGNVAATTTMKQLDTKLDLIIAQEAGVPMNTRSK